MSRELEDFSPVFTFFFIVRLSKMLLVDVVYSNSFSSAEQDSVRETLVIASCKNYRYLNEKFMSYVRPKDVDRQNFIKIVLAV